MARKKRHGNDPRRARGIPGRLRAEKERREIEVKEHQLRVIGNRLHASIAAKPSSRDAGEATEPAPTAQSPEVIASIFHELRQLAFAPRGFVSNTFRQQIWLFLVGHSDFEPHEKRDPAHFAARCADPHRDDGQVEKDIDRSLWHYDILKGIRESERRTKRRALTQVIGAVLRANDQLHYYQGYHDVSSVFLLTLGDQRAFKVIQRVSESYHREAMGSGFETVMQVTRLLFPLLNAEDNELYAYIRESGVEPFFALPWMITWFAHQLQKFQDVARLYDVFLVSHPLFCLYISAALVLEARTRVLKCDCDFGTMHSLLSKLPQTMDIERVIARAALMIHTTSPAELLQLSDMETTLAIDVDILNGASLYAIAFVSRKSTYFACPYDFQQHFGVEKPFLKLPVITQNKTQQQQQSRFGAKSSFIVRAAAVGVVAALVSYAYRSRIQPM